MHIKLRKVIQTIFFMSCFLLTSQVFSSLWTPIHSNVWNVYMPDLRTRTEVLNSNQIHGLKDFSTSRLKTDNALSLRGIQRKASALLLVKNNEIMNHSHGPERLITNTNIVEKTREEAEDDTRSTELKDIFISVKTTKKFHHERLDVILDTWFNLAPNNTYFFSDGEDAELQARTGGHLINTNCPDTHHRKGLCCKMSNEFDTYMESGKRWFCHFDDDIYLNVPTLVKLLEGYSYKDDIYLGRPSINHRLRRKDPDKSNKHVKFSFATGAGFCLSRFLALKILPYTGGGKLTKVCKFIRLSDDCTIGFIVYKCMAELTMNLQFNSHLDNLTVINSHQLQDQVTFSYGVRNNKSNLVDIAGYPSVEDPTRFRSIHCSLHPYLKQCLHIR